MEGRNEYCVLFCFLNQERSVRHDVGMEREYFFVLFYGLGWESLGGR